MGCITHTSSTGKSQCIICWARPDPFPFLFNGGDILPRCEKDQMQELEGQQAEQQNQKALW